jgi:hypothetical protein
MIDIFIRADEVQVGDNVWEHNIVREIDPTDGTMIVFNGSHGWSAKAEEIVMVTNRPTLKMKDWSERDRARRVDILEGIAKYQMQPLTAYQSQWLRELAREIKK